MYRQKNEVSSLAFVILYLSMGLQLITILIMCVMTQLMSFFSLDRKLHEDKKHLFFNTVPSIEYGPGIRVVPYINSHSKVYPNFPSRSNRLLR